MLKGMLLWKQTAVRVLVAYKAECEKFGIEPDERRVKPNRYA